MKKKSLISNSFVSVLTHYTYFCILAFSLSFLNFYAYGDCDFSEGSVGIFFMPIVDYAVGETIGIDEDYVHGGLFVTTTSCDWFFFGQGDAYYMNEIDKWAGSGGLGLRYIDPCLNRVYGVNAFYDYRRGFFDNFHQWGVGFETLSCTWEVRANFYFPIQACKRDTPVVFGDYIGDFFATCELVECAPCAFNAEVGAWCCVDCLFSSYHGIGPYFLSFGCDCFVGVRYRGLFRFGQWLFAEAVVTYDSLYKTRVQGIFGITLPFEWLKCLFTPSCITPCTRRVERFDMIILDQGCCWDWNW